MPMKTTFDLPETLVQDVKRIARERGTTARAIVQQALTRVVDEDAAADEPFVLRDMSVPGWHPALDGAGLNELILRSYDLDERL